MGFAINSVGPIRILGQWDAPWTVFQEKPGSNKHQLSFSEASKDETAFGAVVCLRIICFMTTSYTPIIYVRLNSIRCIIWWMSYVIVVGMEEPIASDR